MSPLVNRRFVALYVSLALASACGSPRDPARPTGNAPPAPEDGRAAGDPPAAVGAAAAAVRIKMVSGNGQSGAAGAALADPLVVRVTDMDGSGVASVAVTWTVASGGGRVSAAATATDPGGVASVAATLGAAAGANTFSATAAGQIGPAAVFAATGATGQPPPDGHPPRIVVRSGPCAGMTVPPDDHDTFWLSVEQPDGPHRHHGRGPEDRRGHHDGHAHDDHHGAHPDHGHPHHPPRPEPRLAVDAHGQVAVGGDVRWPATMVDVTTDEAVTAFTFTYDRPPHHFGHRAAAWETSLRPPHLGSNLLCVRAKVHHDGSDHDGDHGEDGGGHDGRDHDGRDDDHDGRDPDDRDPPHDGRPHGHEHFVRILRPFTAVDAIPPSAVPDLAVGSITATGATVTWGAATDNYGLAGYAVTIDGGAAHRVSAGTRRYVIRGLSPSTRHTVSVVAVDLAGNTSAAPATASFTTAAAPATPPGGDLTITPQEGSAIAAWHPNPLQEVGYRATLDDEVLGELPLAEYCQDAAGNPASPCTAQHTMRFPVSVLEQETPYTLKLEALRADGTVARTLAGTFTTTAGPVVVPESLEEEIATESAQCAGMGGKVYLSPSARAAVTMPAGATQLFAGCYKVADSSCVDANLQAGANKLLGCSDDVTRLLVQLAPKGRGPVISSLDGVVNGPTAPPVPRIPSPRAPIEPQGRVPQGRPPLTELRFPEEFKRIPKVPVAVGGVELLPLVVLAADIAAVVVIDVVLPIAFAEELGIAGLFEYPIHFDTDFDTFDNWGANRGNYYNSLKVYAETIKTTTLYAEGSNLPFKWDETEDQNLKLSIDRACSAQRGSPSLSTPYGCSSDEFAVYVPGGRNYRLQPMPKTGAHIASAMADAALMADPARVQWFYPAYSRGGRAARAAGYRRRWFDTVEFRPNPCNGRIGQVCDEFPFWSTSQAVNLSGIRASLLPVPLLEAAPQGNDLSQFYRRCEVNDNDPFLVLPIEPWIAAGGPSFGFRVKQGAVSLCLVPSP